MRPLDARATGLSVALAIAMVLGASPAAALAFSAGLGRGSGAPPPDVSTGTVSVLQPDVNALTAGSITPASPKMDQGQSVVLASDASGGVQPYFYQWLSGTFPQCKEDVAVPGATNATLSVSSGAGNLYYCYNVSDSESPAVTVSSGATLVAVNASLGAGAITPASPTIDVGNNVTLVAHPTGGDPPYTIHWFTSGTPSGSCELSEFGSGPTHQVSPANTASFCYNVTDSSVGSPTADVYSPPMVLTVDPRLVAGSVTPTAPTIDKGQSIVLTAAPSGGTGLGTYTLQWYSGTTSSCSGSSTKVGANSTTYSASPTSNTSYCYTVTDESTGTTPVLSPLDLVQVDKGLTAGAVTGASPGVDAGQTVELTAHASGGTKPYSYVWYYGTYTTCSPTVDSPFTGQTNVTINITVTSSEYICYAVTDQANSPATQYSAEDLVSVNLPLESGSATPSGPIIDSGRSVNLTAEPVAGTPGYHYAWVSGSSANCLADTTSAGSTQQVTVKPSTTTFYCYKVTDSSAAGSENQTSGPDEVTVNLALKPGSPTPTSPTIDSGQTVNLTANPSNGTPVYTFQWYSGTPTACTTTKIVGATNATYAASPLSNTTYCYTVSDGSQNPPTLTSSPDTVTVNRALLANLAIPGNPSIDLGQSLNLTSNASGGKSPYTYQWYSGSSPTCSADTTVLATTKVLSVSPSATTYYCYKVADSLANPGRANSSADRVTVNSALHAGSVTSNSTAIDAGQSVILLAGQSGGSPPYHYTWYEGSSTNCTNDTTLVKASSPSLKLTVKPPATGSTAYYCFAAVDSSQGTPSVSERSATYKVTVNPVLVNNHILPDSPVVDQGHTVLLKANVTGGTPPLNYTWYSSPNATLCGHASTKIEGADRPTYNATPTTTLYFCVLVADGSTGIPPPPSSNLSAVDLVTVNIPPGPTLLGLPLLEGIIVLGVLAGVCALVGFLIYRRNRKRKAQGGPAKDFL